MNAYKTKIFSYKIFFKIFNLQILIWNLMED